MTTLAQSTDPSKKAAVVGTGGTLIHDIRDISHPDSLFKYSIPRTHFLIHPDWNSELLNEYKREPLDRPAWAWEQQRHSPNVQIPITYRTPTYEKEAPVQKQPIPYKLQIGYQGEVTQAAPPAEITHMVQDRGYYMKATVPRDEKPECFTRNEMEQEFDSRLTTTMKERERLPFHLHY